MGGTRRHALTGTAYNVAVGDGGPKPQSAQDVVDLLAVARVAASRMGWEVNEGPGGMGTTPPSPRFPRPRYPAQQSFGQRWIHSMVRMTMPQSPGCGMDEVETEALGSGECVKNTESADKSPLD